MSVRTTRTKKATETPVVEDVGVSEVPSVSAIRAVAKADPFTALIKSISDFQAEFEKLQKEIAQTKESWVVEQKVHKKQLEDRNMEEELERKRTRENYEYETARKQNIEEDAFADKKAKWEKELKDQQETLEKEKAELLELRKMVDGFEVEKEKVVSQVQEQKELTFKFETERKAREQEVKAEKDILNLRIGNLTTENNRLNGEITNFRKALEEATNQVKEIAVKVIESGTKPQTAEVASS